MTEIKIEYENGKFIEVNLTDYLFFVGGHNKWKRKIIRSLKRFSIAKNLNELEEEVYGENGIEFYYDNKQLKSRNTTILFLEDNMSINKQLSFTKGNLMYQQLTQLQHEIDITTQMERINDELINLELIINQHLSKFSDSISSNLGNKLFSDLLKESLELIYFTEKHEYSLEMINSSELLDEYIKLLEKMINEKEEMVWLVIINPESFLETTDLNLLFEELKRIARETKQLKFFIFSNRSLDINYSIEDIEKTVLLYDTYEQLPEFCYFKESIERHYPDTLNLSSKDLVESFFRISHLVGNSKYDNFYLDARDMILLKVLNSILEVNSSTETSVQQLTKLEKAFLK
ncbi:hypothetical protein DOK76_09145 [Vagococcus sp. DIV0080]|uniref:Uncharacterized protein n=1 Tax=Candidatus Vagococcus giribetii TaxID=2230876 RepID=A0ABS3HTZ7_9ENTE|nr:CRISPR-associated protein Csn2-St [Vagococcus sp. DIV0080]MBO0477238.1 hypothetical protein [Vagococcus sp. DIV0080]